MATSNASAPRTLLIGLADCDQVRKHGVSAVGELNVVCHARRENPWCLARLGCVVWDKISGQASLATTLSTSSMIKAGSWGRRSGCQDLWHRLLIIGELGNIFSGSTNRSLAPIGGMLHLRRCVRNGIAIAWNMSAKHTRKCEWIAPQEEGGAERIAPQMEAHLGQPFTSSRANHSLAG